MIQAINVLTTRKVTVLGKWIVFIIVLLIIYWIFKNLQRPKGTPTKPNEIEDMVRCAHCGLHVPRSESIAANDNYFCSNEHRKLHTKSSS
ncbi:MAG TPA: PP0621 family protein [Nitrosomonas nitrosa]|nr:PP0621 family protein [Nitrosomonas nitrosa]